MKFILSLLSVVSLVAAQTCSFSDPTNGNLYNNLNQATGNTDVQISHNDWAFYLNLCTPVKATACGNNAGICQTWNNGEGHASLGAANTLTFSSLMGSCGIEHENHDWPGFDLAEPVPAASAAACCTLCKSQWSQANAYVFSPNTRNCWCKNVDTDVEPGPAGDRVYGMIGSRYNQEDGLIATYTNGDAADGGTRKAVIYMICNSQRGRGTPTFLREGPPLYYYFTWITSAACRSGTSGAVTGTTGVTGTITTTGAPATKAAWAAGCNPTITQGANSMTFNLAPLEKSDKDYITYDAVGHTYFVNFCRNTLITSCGSAQSAICQKNDIPNYYLIASGQTVTYRFLTNYYQGRSGIEVNLTGGDDSRTATIEMICSPSTDVGRPQFIGEEPILNYMFLWYTKYACPTGSVTTGAPMPSSTTAAAPLPVELYPTSFFDVNTNTLYDMSSLMRAHEDWVAYDQNERPYYINVGRSVITSECADTVHGGRAAAICQTWPGGSATIGAAHGAEWTALTEYSHGKRGLRLNLTGGYEGRSAMINFYCGDPFSLGQPVFLQEPVTLVYHFEWTTSAACGKTATGSCTNQENSDFGGYDTALSPYQNIPNADACCKRCMALTANAYAFQPSATQCWCKNVPAGSVAYPLTDRTYGTIGGSVSSTSSSPATGGGDNKSSGLTGLETFLIIAVVFIVVGVAGGFGYVYWKRRQADQQPPNYLHLNLETAE